MAYSVINYKTKKALKEAITKLNNEKEPFMWFQYGPFGDGEHELEPGRDVTIEGPHFPVLHNWYAIVTNKNGRLVVK